MSDDQSLAEQAHGRYILTDDNVAVPCVDLMEWADWYERAVLTRRILVAEDNFLSVRVSTIFLALDFRPLLLASSPLLFETMVFGGKYDFLQRRCSTYQEAVAQHQRVVRKITGNQLH